MRATQNVHLFGGERPLLRAPTFLKYVKHTRDGLSFVYQVRVTGVEPVCDRLPFLRLIRARGYTRMFGKLGNNLTINFKDTLDLNSVPKDSAAVVVLPNQEVTVSQVYHSTVDGTRTHTACLEGRNASPLTSLLQVTAAHPSWRSRQLLTTKAGIEPAKHGLRADDRTRTGDDYVGNVTFYH